MSHSQASLKRDYMRSIIGVIEGYTRSVDHSSYRPAIYYDPFSPDFGEGTLHSWTSLSYDPESRNTIPDP